MSSRAAVRLFPNWVVRHVREPNLKTAEWLKRPILQFLVSPQMNKIDISEYLRKLYGIPVSKVHTANYLGEDKVHPKSAMKRLKKADYKKAYVYLSDEAGAQRPRYHEIEAQLTPEALASWPAKPGRSVRELREKARQEKQSS